MNAAANMGPAEQMQLAVHYHSQGLLEQARSLYEGLLRRFPNEFAVLYHLGLLEAQAGDVETATRYFGHAVQVNAGHADAQNNLAYTLQQLGRHTEALAAYQQALALQPGDVDIAINLGLLHKKVGQWPEALACFDEALASHPQHTALLCNRGNVLQSLGEPDKALDSYHQALTNEPTNPVVLSNLSNALSELARYEEALVHAQRAIDAHPRHAQAWIERGNACKLMDRTAEAIASFEQALALEPGLVSAHTNLAATVLSDSVNVPRVIESGRKSLAVYLQSTFGAPALRKSGLTMSVFRLQHDVQQATWLQEHGHAVPGQANFLRTGTDALRRAADASAATAGVRLSAAELGRMQEFLCAPWVLEMPSSLPAVVNPDNDLKQHNAGCVTVPHRCNRAVLFNSALFHETDTVHFREGYESRRVNMTYLFGQQLR